MITAEGCALCGATWGDYWEEVDGKRRFFCCDVCAKEYKGILAEAMARKGWARVDSIQMSGDFRGRVCTLKSGGQSYRFMVSFFADGNVKAFVEL